MIKATLTALAMTVAITGMSLTTPAATAQEVIQVSATTTNTTGEFERRSKRLQGDWEIVRRGEKTFIVFSDDFRAARGPDLKIFLSPTAYDDVTGDTAVRGSINIGELQATRGGQEYEIPASVNLADFQSVLVHCEEFAVLWGGSDL